MLWDSKTQKVTDVLYMIANDESSAGFSSFITSTLKKDNRTKKLQLILKMKTIKPDRDVYEEGDVIYTETKSTWYYSFTGSKFYNLKTVWHLISQTTPDSHQDHRFSQINVLDLYGSAKSAA
jgi:hypothetical protein